MIEINCPDGDVRNLKVTNDGNEITGIMGMDISFRPTELMVATITIPVSEIHCEGVKALLVVQNLEVDDE